MLYLSTFNVTSIVPEALAVQAEYGDNTNSQVISKSAIANLIKRCDEYGCRLKTAWEYIMNV